MRQMKMVSCLLVALGQAGFVQAGSPFLPSAALPKNMEAPEPPPEHLVKEANLRARVANGELRYVGSVNNQGVYFDSVLKTYSYHDEHQNTSIKENKK